MGKSTTNPNFDFQKITPMSEPDMKEDFPHLLSEMRVSVSLRFKCCYITVCKPQPADSWGAEWKQASLAGDLTLSELKELNQSIQEAIQVMEQQEENVPRGTSD